MSLFATLGANNYMPGLGHGHQFIIGKLQMHLFQTIAKKILVYSISTNLPSQNLWPLKILMDCSLLSVSFI